MPVNKPKIIAKPKATKSITLAKKQAAYRKRVLGGKKKKGGCGCGGRK